MRPIDDLAELDAFRTEMARYRKPIRSGTLADIRSALADWDARRPDPNVVAPATKKVGFFF